LKKNRQALGAPPSNFRNFTQGRWQKNFQGGGGNGKNTGKKQRDTEKLHFKPLPGGGN